MGVLGVRPRQPLLWCLVVCALFAVAETSADEASTTDRASSKIELEVGQVWKYQTRQGEPLSRAVVLKLEEDENLGSIVHVQLTEIRFDPSASRSGTIGHLPYQETAFRESLVELEETLEDLPEFAEGYRIWREAFDREEAGVFTVPLREAVDFIVRSVPGA